MALPTPHPTLREQTVFAFSRSLGTSPETAYAVFPFRGRIVKVGSVLYGALTTGDATVATTINGTPITNGSITVTQSGSAAGQVNTTVPTSANIGNEGDFISFPPTGSGGSNVGAMFFATIQAG